MSVPEMLTALLFLGAGCGVGLTLARGRAAALVAQRDALRGEREGLRGELAAVGAARRQAEAEVAGLQVTIEHYERTNDGLKETFAALSAEALRHNNHQFVQLAEARLKQATTEASGDLARRQQAIDALVLPLRESLTKVEGQIQTVERERIDAYRSLMEQVGAMRQGSEQLKIETAQLVTALRAPQVRGRWGEMQLRRVVEAAGMIEHCDFTEQVTVQTPDGSTLRPDVVVHLAGGKQVVVDAKVAFVGYLEAMEARDDVTKAARLKAHARHLRTHIDQLGAKSYWEHFTPTPEFVVMFVPADAFLNAALEEDPSLQEHAFSRNVVIATPSTLIALLRTVSYTWRQEALARNAADIHSLGRELHGRLATMGGHMSRLGGQLNNAVAAYNSTVSSLEGRVLVTARRFSDLQVCDEELPSPGQVELVTRQVQAPELVASASDMLIALPEQASEAWPTHRHAGGG
ncbi:MAG: DNA recombination protein RmuC [Actinomycetota bacterium]|nr:DNA recombination protein RmuC [Actinomycetota bacterium]